MIKKPQRIDWLCICSFAEVKTEHRMLARIKDTINAKSYLSFILQFDRRFTTALSFNGSGEYTLTLTDREGQISYMSSLKGNGLEPAQRFLTILSFFKESRKWELRLIRLRLDSASLSGPPSCVFSLVAASILMNPYDI
jgi:hypothetical protein